MWMLPVEIQQIILRYAGIYYARDLDQLLFAMHDKEDCFNELDQIIYHDDVEALKLYVDTKVTRRTMYLCSLSICSIENNAYQCFEYLGPRCKEPNYQIKDAITYCILRNSCNNLGEFVIDKRVKDMRKTSFFEKFFELSNIQPYSSWPRNQRKTSYINSDRYKAEFFEKMVILFDKYCHENFVTSCYECGRDDLLQEVKIEDFKHPDHLNIDRDFDHFVFLYDSPIVKNNPNLRQIIGDWILFFSPRYAMHIICGGYRASRAVLDRFIAAKNPKFCIADFNAIVTLLELRLKS